MGLTVSARVFWGFPLSSDKPSEWREREEYSRNWEDYFAAMSGILRPTMPYTDENKSLFVDYWHAKRSASNAEPCQVGIAVSYDEPVEFVAVKASMFGADWGDVNKIANTALEVKPEWREQLQAFCKLMGIEWREPAWYITSLYGH